MEDCDTAACSGTHVRRTIEVGPIKILAREGHSKNVTRIDYVVGKRAVQEIARDGQVLAEVSESLSASRDQLGQIVQKMASDLRQAEKHAQELGEMLAEYRVQELTQGGEIVGGVRLLVDVIDYLGTDAIRKMVAKTISGQESVVMALIGAGERLTITAGRSDNIDVNLSPLIAGIAREHGGGGGGRPNFVSAGGIVASPNVIRDQVKTKLEQALQGG
jgi:alanyl-tRNA synthetase